MTTWDVATVRFSVAPVRRLTMQCNKVVLEEEHSFIESKHGKRTSVNGARQRLLAESEGLERQKGRQFAVRHG